MGDLLKEIHTVNAGGGQKRKMKMLMAQLSEADQRDLEAACKDMSISGTAIVKALAKRGHIVGYSTIAKWRRDSA